MSKIGINHVTNTNIYLDGTDLLGRAKETKFPDASAIMQEHKVLGMMGKVKLLAGFDKLRDEVKRNNFYHNAMLSATNPYKSLVLRCRSSVRHYSSQELIDGIPLITFLTIIFKKNPPGTFKQHRDAEFSSSFTCTYIKQILNGEELLQLDYLANIFRVGGVDQLTDYRINIGGWR